MHNDKLSYKGYQFGTQAIHAGQAPDASTGAIMTPIFQTSTYVQSSPGKHLGYEYSRTQNPTRHALEDCIATLEKGNHGIAFGSGCAAIATVLHMLPPDTHVISGDDIYGGSYRLFNQVMSQRGIEFTFVDMTSIDNIEAAITDRTSLIWLESPTNPLLKICDIGKICDLAHQHQIKVAVDNTFMSPFLQNPLELGADMVVHSTTKFINGHSDVVGGIVVTREEELAKQLHFLQNSLGAIPGPFDCWLILRAVKTLHVRMQQHVANAKIIAKYLEEHPKISRVIYPGLPSHPQYKLAQEQMKGPGGMITFFLKDGLREAKKLLENVKVFSLAESLGGVESLIEHPAIMTHASVPKDVRESLGISDGLVRLSVGIESCEDLIQDLDQALNS